MGGSDTNLKVDDARTDKDASTLTLFYYELSTRNNTLTERALNNSHKLRIHPFDEISRAESSLAEYGRRNCKRVTVGATSIVRIPNVHRISQINSAPGKIYAR